MKLLLLFKRRLCTFSVFCSHFSPLFLLLCFFSVKPIRLSFLFCIIFFFCDSFKGLLVIGVGGFGVADLDSGGMLCG